ncbi:MAG: chorismate mutase [Phenylobacterium sp.]|uniref:chorismate mutase n=1 Tax=Phenylobacterium sp. TaxID=1871053 RepID=UPI0025E612B5|nr:chorismate mutase [Phenylobacterium sp.]MCG9915012.1 chorismate mutase [Phenylobacterium sp.]
MLIEIDDHKAPADCQTMAEVRQGVDALDRALVKLLAERQGFMDAAARIKPHRGVVRDEARIEDVVAKVRAAARDAGLSEAIAEPVWRTLIDRCIAYEFGAWDKTRTAERDSHP